MGKSPASPNFLGIQVLISHQEGEENEIIKIPRFPSGLHRSDDYSL